MSFQAYLETIKQKTGLGPEDFVAAAEAKGFLTPGVAVQEIVDWLKTDYDLGRGHAMALVSIFKDSRAGARDVDAVVAEHFAGARAHWRPVYDDLLASLAVLGPVHVAPTTSYLSLLRGKSKFAILAFTADRMDVGIKLKGTEPTGRFAASGSWNSMVTHRVRISSAGEVDAELHDWLRRAWEAAA